MTFNYSVSVTVLKGRVLFSFGFSTLEFALALFPCYGEQHSLQLQYHLSRFISMFDSLALAVKGLGIKNGDVMFLRQSQKSGDRKMSQKMATATDETWRSCTDYSESTYKNNNS